MSASVVLNGARSSTRVSEQTRARIVEAAARLHYRPNAVARSLSRKLVDTIGVVSTVDLGGDVNVYFLEVLNGILEAAAESKQNITVFSIADWRRDEHRILSFFDGRVDGVVLLGAHSAPKSLGAKLPHHTPCVMIHGSITLPHVPNIDVDSEAGAYDLVRYIHSLGHSRIAHFTGDADILASRQRLGGYRRALRDCGIGADDRLVFEGQFNLESGRACAGRLLHRSFGAALPTAIFCASDAIACGCMEVLAERGLRVPGDISVAGFDDTLAARMARPALTTVRQPFRRMGRRAVELLLPRIRSDVSPASEREPCLLRTGPTANDETEVFGLETIVRDSVSPPRPSAEFARLCSSARRRAETCVDLPITQASTHPL